MKTNGLVQRLVLASVLGLGFVVVWGLVSSWAGDAVTHAGRPNPIQESLAFLSDGALRIMRQSSDGLLAQTEYFDLEGNHVAPPNEEKAAGWIFPQLLSVGLKAADSNQAVPWGQRYRFAQDYNTPLTYWYFRCDNSREGSAYFEGFDSVAKRRVGYLGTNGFREDPPPAAECFSVDRRAPLRNAACFQWMNGAPIVREFALGYATALVPGPGRPGTFSESDCYLLTPAGTLYRADLRRRTVVVLLDRPDLRAIRMFQVPQEPARTGVRLAVRAADAVLVLDERGAVQKQYAIPEPLRGEQFSFGETTTGEAVMHRALPHGKLATAAEHRVYWVSSKGAVRSLNVTLPAPGMPTGDRVLAGFIFPTPLGLLGGFAFDRFTGSLTGEMGGTLGEALSRALRIYWPGLVLAQLIATACAWLCYRRQVRFGLTGSEQIAWPLFVLVFGLPGWVGYRFGRTWPALEACPACGADAPQDRAGCHRCDADFPLPALRGTEVFA